MSVVVIAPPGPILSLVDAKAHLRIDGGDEDDYVTALIGAAQGTIDGPPGWLGRCLGLQTLEVRAPSFGGFTGGGLVLPFVPIVDLVSVSYLAQDGTTGAVDVADVVRDADGGLCLAPGRLWPVTALRQDAVRVRYRVGYPDTPADGGKPAKSTVPAPIVHALKVMVGLLYENRSGAADLQTNATVANLLGPFRVWGF